MKTIDKYILKNFLKSIFISLLAFILISILTQLSRAINFVLDGKMTGLIATKWLFSVAPEVTVLLAPLSALLGGLIVVNKMSKSLEIIALKTSGISFLRIVKYPIISAFIFSLLVGVFNDKVAVVGNRTKREIRHKYQYNLEPVRMGTQIYRKGFGDYLYYIRIANGDNNTLSNFLVVNMNQELSKVYNIITAERVKYNIEKNEWLGEKVWFNDIINDLEIYYPTYKFDFFEENINDLLRDKFYEDEASIKELRENIIYLQRAGGDVRKLLVEYHKRWAYPFSVLVMSIIGLSLGSKYVRGASAISIAISIILGYSYYVMQSMLEAASIGGTVSPVLGAWLPNAIYLAGGAYTMYKAEF